MPSNKVKFSDASILFLYLLFSVCVTLIFSEPFVPLLCISLFEIYRQIKANKAITAYSFWHLGFSFIIGLDGILLKEKIVENTTLNIYYETALLFYISQFIIIWRYRSIKTKVSEAVNNKPKKVSSTFFIIIVILYCLYLYTTLPGVIEAFFTSRFETIKDDKFGGLNTDRSLFLLATTFINQYSGYILPSLILIWNLRNKTMIYAIIITCALSLPIWLGYFIEGTRHYLLYSALTLLGTFTLLRLKMFKFKPTHLVLLVMAYFMSNLVLEARKHGFLNYITGNINEKYDRLEKKVTDQTTVYMSYVLDYYDDRPFEYGSSSAAILLFWVPRTIWHDKPPQFGYWFIRAYYGGQKGFGDKHSAPASYLAAVYSDFGYLGIIGISYFFGYLFSFSDRFFNRQGSISDYRKVILIAFFLASAFFLPRQLSHLFNKFTILFFFLFFLFYLEKYRLVVNNK